MQIGHWGSFRNGFMIGTARTIITGMFLIYMVYIRAIKFHHFRTPDLFEAAKTSLIARGDESTGWSMGWKVNLWARLLDGNHAYKLIKDQLKAGYSTKKGKVILQKEEVLIQICLMRIRHFRLMEISDVRQVLQKCFCKVKMDLFLFFPHCRMSGRKEV